MEPENRRISVPISDEVDVKQKLIIREQEGHSLHTDKETIQQNITMVNAYAPEFQIDPKQ